jgi:hypothetical protein
MCNECTTYFVLWVTCMCIMWNIYFVIWPVPAAKSTLRLVAMLRHHHARHRVREGKDSGQWLAAIALSLRRRKASEARANTFILSRLAVECGRFLGLIRAWLPTTRVLSVVTVSTLLLINSIFHEQAIYWSTQSSIAQILTRVRIPLPLLGQYLRYVPSGIQQLVAENGLTAESKIKRNILKIHGITGNFMPTKGQSDLRIGDISSWIYGGRKFTYELWHY